MPGKHLALPKAEGKPQVLMPLGPDVGGHSILCSNVLEALAVSKTHFQNNYKYSVGARERELYGIMSSVANGRPRLFGACVNSRLPCRRGGGGGGAILTRKFRIILIRGICGDFKHLIIWMLVGGGSRLQPDRATLHTNDKVVWPLR